jgi:uncharacterized protein YbbK (DUF523 family)
MNKSFIKNKTDKLAETTAGGSEAIIVSACLLGLPTRYDGGECKDAELISRLGGDIIIALCPEQLGGLSTPRAPSEITGGDGTSVLDGTAKVKDAENTDVTEAFIKGAEEVLRIALLNSVSKAYLKEKSPSCGVNLIKKNNKDQKGSGVLAALLKKNNIEVIAIS